MDVIHTLACITTVIISFCCIDIIIIISIILTILFVLSLISFSYYHCHASEIFVVGSVFVRMSTRSRFADTCSHYFL